MVTLNQTRPKNESYIPIFDRAELEDLITKGKGVLDESLESFGKGVGTGLSKDANVNIGLDFKTLVIPGLILIGLFLLIK